MKVILIDDELIALELLSIMLEGYSDIEIVGIYTDPNIALKEIKKIQPDAIFLDIEMGEINGLEFAQILDEQMDDIEIVFVTAYSQYAVDAFELNAMDYLLKPIQEKRLRKTLSRLKEKLKLRKDIVRTKDKMRVNSLGGFYLVSDSDDSLNWRTQKTKELFAYLWRNQGREVSKMLIIENIFPDRELEKATTNLHTTIYQLRKSLSTLGYKDPISYVNESYRLNIEIESDIESLERLMYLKKYGEKEIEEILELYKGDFFQEEGYHWALEAQIQYKEEIINILKKYTEEQFEKGNYERRTKYCLDKMFYMDPFNEEIARMMIDYYGKLDKKDSLAAFFTNFKRNLFKELGLNPEDDTINLYKLYM